MQSPSSLLQLPFALLSLRLLGGVALSGPGGPVTGRAAHKRRLGLLARLALAPQRTLSRDKLIGVLWPESDDEQARHLLSQSLGKLAPFLTGMIERRYWARSISSPQPAEFY